MIWYIFNDLCKLMYVLLQVRVYFSVIMPRWNQVWMSVRVIYLSCINIVELHLSSKELWKIFVKVLLTSFITILFDVHRFIFSHTQRVSVTLVITLCPSLSSWTFSLIRLFLSNHYTDLPQILCGMGGPLLIEIRDRDTIPYSYEWSQEIF